MNNNSNKLQRTQTLVGEQLKTAVTERCQLPKENTLDQLIALIRDVRQELSELRLDMQELVDIMEDSQEEDSEDE